MEIFTKIILNNMKILLFCLNFSFSSAEKGLFSQSTGAKINIIIVVNIVIRINSSLLSMISENEIIKRYEINITWVSIKQPI